MEQLDNSLNFKVSARSRFQYALPTILSNIFMNVIQMAVRGTYIYAGHSFLWE